MPITLVTESGSETANSYNTLEENDDILAELDSLPGLGVDTSGYLTSPAPGDEIKKRSMVMAFNAINALDFPGYRNNSNQTGAFPRTGTGIPGMDGTIPDAVKYAQAAQSASYHVAPTAAQQAAQSGLASETSGKVSKTWKFGSSSTVDRQVCPAAIAILRDAGLFNGGPASVTTFRC